MLRGGGLVPSGAFERPCLSQGFVSAAGLLRVAVLTCRPHRLSQPRSCASQSEQAAELVLPPLTFDKPLQRGAVHFVSTPIGNLEDITLRAIRTLREADVIATEDPKVTSPLLRRLGIERKELPLVTHNDNNLERSVPKLVEYALQGLLVAIVSDAGTPAISDPGLGLAAACAEREVPTVPVPGPCGAIAAVTVSAFDCSEFLYVGFVSRGSAEKAKARRRLREIATEARPVVLYEAPHRLLATLSELSAAGAGARGCFCAREITKRHEELKRGTVASVLAWYTEMAERDGKVRGEVTLVLSPLGADAMEAREAARQLSLTEQVDAALRARLAAGDPVSSTAKQVAVELGVPKKAVYARALQISKAEAGEANGPAEGIEGIHF